MAESQTDPLAEYKAELDRISAKVQPDTWLGHGRLKIAERDFTAEKRRFALRLLDRLGEKYPDKDAEALAEKAAELAEDKL